MAQDYAIDELTQNDWFTGTVKPLVLKPLPGKTVTDTTGNMDKRLFTGENNLNVVFENGQLWRLRFDHGSVPGPLNQHFTSFAMALKTAKEYYAKRNVSVEPK